MSTIPPLAHGADGATNERRLLDEIDRLRREVDRLSDELRAERLERWDDARVEAVLAPRAADPADLRICGRSLPDGRFIPLPVTDGGTSAPAEPGAPRPATADAPVAEAELSEAELPEAETSETELSLVDGFSLAGGLALTDRHLDLALDDDSATAFDEFFNMPDPQLDKIRRFLLD